MSIDSRLFGCTENGDAVKIFTLKNDNNISVEITNYGGRIVSIFAPDRWDKTEDVVLGFSTFSQYLAPNPFFGAIMGRCANRIANAEISINGKNFNLSQNNKNHHIHGGFRGFDRVLWRDNFTTTAESSALILKYFSKDGEEGYPGNLNVEITYTLNANNSLQIDYFATTDQDTLVNLTNHTYFNLLGEGKGNILNHSLKIDSDCIVEVDQELIPTGILLPVDGTRFDFRQFQIIGARSYRDQDGNEKVGYDRNWVLKDSQKGLEKRASLIEPTTGRCLEVSTTLPGMQVYTANKIDKSMNLIGKSGNIYGSFPGICLETQFFPDAIHHNHFPSPILRKDETYRHTTAFHFSTI